MPIHKWHEEYKKNNNKTHPILFLFFYSEEAA
jgi:hypothetical protein